MFAKIAVNGAQADKLFQFLRRQRRGLLGTSGIKWNFTKFLVDRTGHVTARIAPSVAPERLIPEIELLLGGSP